MARVEAFVTSHLGIYAGYRTYEIDFDDSARDIRVNLLWNGFTVGGAVRF